MKHNLDAMAIFAAIGEHGSISAAARALGRPKATISRALAGLEADYGVVLAERSTKRMRLTEIGEQVLMHCRRMLAEIADADAAIAAHRGHPSGILSVGMPTAIARDFLGPHLGEFLADHPDIDLRLLVGDNLANPLAHGLDLVLHAGRLEDSELIARKITNIDVVLVASPAYLDRVGRPRQAADLAQHQLLMRSMKNGQALPDEEWQLENGGVIRLPSAARLASNDPVLALSLALQGIGIAPVAAIIAGAHLRSGALERVLPELRLARPPSVHAVYVNRRALAPKVRAFIEFTEAVARRALAAI